MAATRLIPMHVNKGKTAAASLKERLVYSQNPEKTEGGELIASYECDPRLAWQEFALIRGEYLTKHSREKESDVIAYQIRQSFKPGEVDPEEANKIGYDLAMRFTKGKHAFTVSTHTDRAHIHNHIIFNAVNLTGDRKFRNFFLSSYALRRLSDLICSEHGLSVIEEKPKHEWQKHRTYKREQSQRDILRMDLDDILAKRPKTFDEMLAQLEALGYDIKRGKYTAVKNAKMERFVRFRSLGEGYTEEDLLVAITQKQPRGKASPDEEMEFSLLKDLEKALKEKGIGYEKWAQGFNVKQKAKMLVFLRENNIGSQKELDALAKESAERFHELSGKIKACEAKLSEIAELKKTIINYSKTRSIYEAYRKAGYSKTFYEEHRADIIIHQAAKKKFDALGTKKIPRVKDLSDEYEKILAEKKEAYSEYRAARSEMQKYSVAQKNVAMILGPESVPERNAQPSREA